MIKIIYNLLPTLIFVLNFRAVHGHTGADLTPVEKETKKRQINDFNELIIKGAINVHYQQGPSDTLIIQGTAKSMARLKIQSKNGKLSLTLDGKFFSKKENASLDVIVQSTSISKIVARGGAKVTAMAPLIADTLSLRSSSGSDLVINVLASCV